MKNFRAVVFAVAASACISAPPSALAAHHETKLNAHPSAQYTPPVVIHPAKPLPLPRQESVPETPRANARWIPGDYYWDDSEWVWADGYWRDAPFAQARWVPGHWVQRWWGTTWVPGYWV